MVGCASVSKNCVPVVLGMRSGKISAVKIEIVLLLAVIGQWLARNLSSGNTSTVGEYRKKQRIHTGPFLKHIEDFLGTFIHKRDCSDLDADHFAVAGGCSATFGVVAGGWVVAGAGACVCGFGVWVRGV